MPKQKSWLTSSLLILFDSAAIYAVFRLALIIRNLSAPLFQRGAIRWQAGILIFQLGLLFLLLIFFLQGLYPGHGLTAVKELEQIGRAVSLAFILLGSVSYLVKGNLEGREYKVFGYKGKQVRDNIHSLDVDRFIAAFVDGPRRGEVYNLSGGKANSTSIL